MGLLPQAHHEAAAPSSGVHPALQAWQGEASRCREADGQLLGAEGNHARHGGKYDGLVAANEPLAPEFSPQRVLKNYDDMTTSEFQSHLIKLDTTFRGDKALNTGKPNTEDFVINESTVNCWWYNPEVHQKQLLDFFKAYGRACDERRTLIFYGDSGKGKTPLASCLAAMVARDVGLDEFVMVSSPDMLRSAVERSLLRDERPLLKYILAVQAPWSPAKLPYNGS